MPSLKNTPVKLSERALQVIDRYGDGLKFTETFNPSLQAVCAQNLEKTFMGSAPSIASICQAYPIKQVNTWIMAQLRDLYKFAGVKEKLNIAQMENLSLIIQTEYYYFKASELLLFFHKMKAGVYGVFYGVVDPIVITAALVEFRDYRHLQHEFYEREMKQQKQQEERDRWQKNAVPCPAHCKLAGNYIEQLEPE